jgi:nitrate reductase NapA
MRVESLDDLRYIEKQQEPTMSQNRRAMLKSAAMAAAGSMVAGKMSLPVVHADQDVSDLPSGEGLQWNKAPCRFCGTGCHVQVGVEDGRVVAVAGDKAADVNKGLLCVKGYHVGGILYGKDRLTKPLLRKDGKLTEISWDEAIETIAQRIFD